MDSNTTGTSKTKHSPFSESDFGERSDPNTYGNYSSLSKTKIDIEKEKAFLILFFSNFIMTITYDKVNGTSINYEEINYKNENGIVENIGINEVKDLTSEDRELNERYRIFINYLINLEDTLRKEYKKENSTEIKMEIRMKSSYHVDCKFIINDDTLEDNEFNEQDFLYDDDYNKCTGWRCMVDVITQ